MGVVQRRTPQERRREREFRRRRDGRRQQPQRQSTSPISPPPPARSWSNSFSYKGWNLLPMELFTYKGLYFSMCFLSSSFRIYQRIFSAFSPIIFTSAVAQLPLPIIETDKLIFIYLIITPLFCKIGTVEKLTD